MFWFLIWTSWTQWNAAGPSVLSCQELHHKTQSDCWPDCLPPPLCENWELHFCGACHWSLIKCRYVFPTNALLCLKAPRNESHLYNFYSVSSIKVRICGQEYETRLLSRQKWKQWKSKRRNDCSFNCRESLWANVIIPSAFCWDCRISRDYCSIFYVFLKTISNFWVLSIFYFLYLENITVIKLSDRIINMYIYKVFI